MKKRLVIMLTAGVILTGIGIAGYKGYLDNGIKAIKNLLVTESYAKEMEVIDAAELSEPEEEIALESEEADEQALQDAKDQEDLKAYQEYNSDVVGIIRIKDTVLNHPICQTIEEEDFYLRRDLDKKYNSHGVPFLTVNSDLNAKKGNNLIYGHNIHKNSRDVFCDLALYEDFAFYRKNPIIDIVTPRGTDHYLIFAYYLIDTSDSDTFCYYENSDWTVDDYKAYMDEVDKRNWLDVPVKRTSQDVYLTLSSCSNELAGTKTNRMVVMAKKLTEDEDYVTAVVHSKKAKNPLLPQKLR